MGPCELAYGGKLKVLSDIGLTGASNTVLRVLWGDAALRRQDLLRVGTPDSGFSLCVLVWATD